MIPTLFLSFSLSFSFTNATSFIYFCTSFDELQATGRSLVRENVTLRERLKLKTARVSHLERLLQQHGVADEQTVTSASHTDSDSGNGIDADQTIVAPAVLMTPTPHEGSGAVDSATSGPSTSEVLQAKAEAAAGLTNLLRVVRGARGCVAAAKRPALTSTGCIAATGGGGPTAKRSKIKGGAGKAPATTTLTSRAGEHLAPTRIPAACTSEHLSATSGSRSHAEQANPGAHPGVPQHQVLHRPRETAASAYAASAGLAPLHHLDHDMHRGAVYMSRPCIPPPHHAAMGLCSPQLQPSISEPWSSGGGPWAQCTCPSGSFNFYRNHPGMLLQPLGYNHHHYFPGLAPHPTTMLAPPESKSGCLPVDISGVTEAQRGARARSEQLTPNSRSKPKSKVIWRWRDMSTPASVLSGSVTAGTEAKAVAHSASDDDPSHEAPRQNNWQNRRPNPDAVEEPQ